MSSIANIFVTFILVALNCSMALFIPDIGSSMTLVGSTINPIVGFVLPIIFYWP